MNEKPLHPDVGDAVRSYREPPAVPRDAIWAGIRARRAASRSDGRHPEPRRRRGRTARYRAAWSGWRARITAAAAVLVLAFGLGRIAGWWGAPADPVARAGESAASPAAAASGLAAAVLAHPMAVEHLNRAETLLALFRDDAKTGRRHPDLVPWAVELLAETRILLDSPAVQDPAFAALLGDLELVLAQIAHLAVDADDAEVRLALEGIEAADMLVRLHSAVPDAVFAAGL